MTTMTTPKTLASAQLFLREQAARIEIDPLTNSVFALAQTLFRDLERGDAKISDLSKLADEVHLDLIEERAERFRDQHSGGKAKTAWASLTEELEALAGQGFEAFKARVEQSTGGIVFTGHPTFALSRDLRTALADHVVSATKTSRTALQRQIRADSRAWNQQISLQGEHDEVQDAVEHAANAQLAYASVLISVARKAFPDDWRSLKIYVPTIACWVGYDLDGRADIHWSQSLTFRLTEKAVQLGRYAAQLEAISGSQKIGPLAKLTQRLKTAAEDTAGHAALFAADLTDPDNLVPAANALTAPSKRNVLDASEIVDVLDEVIATAEDGLAAKLMAIRAQVEALQLGTARIHLRVNAAQVRTVINRDLGLQTEDRELGRLALAELAQKARKSKPVQVNFADLFLEQSTARRQFMMCAQILKHIDAGSVIRFLIAE
ncbi:MAG TPA: phosphoenolpyruvate carboxylase, partial [Hyphomonas atlantica]|nr:phosphoenolpyruvate carboxylase [Hyphomonas atlantica]